MSTIKIYIRNLEGRALEIKVNTNDTIYQGKTTYYHNSDSSISISNLQWKFGSQVLKNDKTFAFYGIEEEDNISSNDRTRGGKKQIQYIKSIQ